MEFLQGYFGTALLALVFSCIIVKLVSSAVYGDGEKGKERVKFVGDGLVGGVDQVEIHGGEVVDGDAGKVFVEKPQMDEQCIEEKVEGSKVEGGDVLRGCLVDEEELKKASKVVGEDVLRGCLVGEEELKKASNAVGEDVLRGCLVGEEELKKASKAVGEDVLRGCLVDEEELKNEGVGEKNIVELDLVRKDTERPVGENTHGLPIMEVGIPESNRVAYNDIKGDRNMAGEHEAVCGPRQEHEMVGVEGGSRQEDNEKETRERDEDVSNDDWEGIERSDLEILFAKAINFVECGNDNALLNSGSELEMQMYGLQKIAMEGPCYEPQPMAFKLSARAKWNAWQRMGSMSPEVAMEQYVRLLSDTVPGWITRSSTESCVSSSSAIRKNRDPDRDTTSPDIDRTIEK